MANLLLKLLNKVLKKVDTINTLASLSTLKKRKKPLKVIVGSGGIQLPGWISTDIEILDITKDDDWCRLFREEIIECLLTEHVLEHLSFEECDRFFSLAYRYLQNGGCLRIAVPDGCRPDKKYLEEVAPPADGHKILFTYNILSEMLKKHGFHIELLEWFDENHQFHQKDWKMDRGIIFRSAKLDCQEEFKLGRLYYTSLIVDAVKR
ncbi:MAG: hypothetical protein D6732_09410 [Methanobacteriota archaeon]|nr:MAG: hypothetical protein D6732_09410 [Euryarchaeota archaeon]